MTVELIQVTPEQLTALIRAAVSEEIKTALAELPKGEAQPEYITLKEAGRLMGYTTTRTVKKHLRLNGVKIHTISNALRVSRADVLALPKG